MLKKGLQRLDACILAVQQLLGKDPYIVVLFLHPVPLLQAADHASGVHLDHQIRDPGVAIAAPQLHPHHAVSEKAMDSVHFRQFPAPLQGYGIGFRFQGMDSYHKIDITLGYQLLHTSPRPVVNPPYSFKAEEVKRRGINQSVFVGLSYSF